jgi:translation initiation factor 2B subunit (eIF-2B alpha/beta/delta family)
MEVIHVVSCFLRNRAAVLLVRRSDAVGSYTGRWGAIAGHVAPDPDEPAADRDRDPDAAAHAEIAEEAGLADAVTLVRRGDPFPVEDADLDTRWVVHPYLFDCDSRDVAVNAETTEYEWVPPTEILRRETVPDLWKSYDRVRPGVDAVADDRTHGSASLSLRALETLRDEAALAVERDAGDWNALAALARELRAARPSMPVVANRVNRVVHAAVDDRTPAAVETAATDALDAALDAAVEAAATAAERIAEERVVTLSRSGTVREALARADPAAVLVAESRPGAEGVGVAESLAGAGVDTTIAPDAAVAHALSTGDWDAVLVGADAILPDGAVVNKLGTRAFALAAAREDLPVYAVAAADKITPDPEPRLERADPAAVYDGDADLAVAAPLFDVTPADLVTGCCTERGLLDAEAVAAVAEEHGERAAW